MLWTLPALGCGVSSSESLTVGLSRTSRAAVPAWAGACDHAHVFLPGLCHGHAALGAAGLTQPPALNTGRPGLTAGEQTSVTASLLEAGAAGTAQGLGQEPEWGHSGADPGPHRQQVWKRRWSGGDLVTPLPRLRKRLAWRLCTEGRFPSPPPRVVQMLGQSGLRKALFRAGAPGRLFRLPRARGPVCVGRGSRRLHVGGRSRMQPGVRWALVWVHGRRWLGACCILSKERGSRLSHGSRVSLLVSAWARDAVCPSPLGPASRATILF